MAMIGMISAMNIGVMIELTIIAKTKEKKKWLRELNVSNNFCKERHSHGLWITDHIFRKSKQFESIQGTCRLSLKMGRADEQKPPMHCIRR